MDKKKLRETARDIMSDIKSAADEGKLTASEIILSYCDIVHLAEDYALSVASKADRGGDSNE